MSKAFTREDDTDEAAPPRPLPTLPPGAKDYITREGAENLRGELERLQAKRAEAAGDRARIQSLDQRIAQIQTILVSVSVVEPIAVGDEQARFGAYVRVKYASGEIEVFRIVGIHEIDLDRNWISWQSPLGRALLNAKAGETVDFKAPAGVQRLKIEAISDQGF